MISCREAVLAGEIPRSSLREEESCRWTKPPEMPRLSDRHATAPALTARHGLGVTDIINGFLGHNVGIFGYTSAMFPAQPADHHHAARKHSPTGKASCAQRVPAEVGLAATVAMRPGIGLLEERLPARTTAGQVSSPSVSRARLDRTQGRARSATVPAPDYRLQPTGPVESALTIMISPLRDLAPPRSRPPRSRPSAISPSARSFAGSFALARGKRPELRCCDNAGIAAQRAAGGSGQPLARRLRRSRRSASKPKRTAGGSARFSRRELSGRTHWRPSGEGLG